MNVWHYLLYYLALLFIYDYEYCWLVILRNKCCRSGLADPTDVGCVYWNKIEKHSNANVVGRYVCIVRCCDITKGQFAELCCSTHFLKSEASRRRIWISFPFLTSGFIDRPEKHFVENADRCCPQDIWYVGPPRRRCFPQYLRPLVVRICSYFLKTK